jgi:hypothetical protein
MQKIRKSSEEREEYFEKNVFSKIIIRCFFEKWSGDWLIITILNIGNIAYWQG